MLALVGVLLSSWSLGRKQASVVSWDEICVDTKGCIQPIQCGCQEPHQISVDAESPSKSVWMPRAAPNTNAYMDWSVDWRCPSHTVRFLFAAAALPHNRAPTRSHGLHPQGLSPTMSPDPISKEEANNPFAGIGLVQVVSTGLVQTRDELAPNLLKGD
eukprot:364894-Chlamydomonas_euryale.AAC.1